MEGHQFCLVHGMQIESLSPTFPIQFNFCSTRLVAVTLCSEHVSMHNVNMFGCTLEVGGLHGYSIGLGKVTPNLSTNP